MGCRAAVYFIDSTSNKTSPGVYLHWDGDKVSEHLQTLQKQMEQRTDDAMYSAARFCQIACNEHHRSNTGIGLLQPEDIDVIRDIRDFQGLCYGSILVDVSEPEFKIEQYGQMEGNDL